jgi:hypothetical protein
VYRLPEDVRVLPKYTGVNKNCTVMYIRCAYVGFIMNNSYTWLTPETPSLYCVVNTFYFGYKNQSVYVIEGKSYCLFQDKYNTHTYSVSRI